MPYFVRFLLFGFLIGALACQPQPDGSYHSSNGPVNEETGPRALRDDVTVEKLMDIERGCIRINYDPIRGTLLYNTMKGDIYRVATDGSGAAAPEKIHTVEDHGIERLQGFRLYDSLMFLVGNVPANGDKGTKGKIVRGKLQADGTYAFTTLAITEDYGKSGTVYSHEFNGVAVDHEGRYIYVNSGSRTDHGEVQDNQGAYPGLREAPLTACIFRLPANGENILLRNDSTYLAQAGYLFADGARNTYDLTVSPEGHIFGVSNSSDYDHSEEMNWFREGHHYGYPWEMGNTQNPQQFADWIPEPEHDPFINTKAFAYNSGAFYNDPDFPKKPASLTITPPIQNYGPDANLYRDRETGKIMDGDDTGQPVGTFTAHRSPLGLFFDQDSVLAADYRGDAFVLSWSVGTTQPLMQPFSELGGDLMHLELTYVPDIDNYRVHCYRIVGGFSGPTDAALVGNVVYIIENTGFIWRVSLPVDASSL